MKLIAEEIGIDLHTKVKNYEVSVHYRLNSGKVPLKEIPNAENKDFVRKFSDVIGENLSSFSIRLAKKDSSIYQGDWIDIAIEPDLTYENYYHVGVVFRNSNREKTETFVKDLETNVLKLIDLIEA
jgi:ribosome biogenesis protein Nip4